VLDHGSARGRSVIGNGLNPTMAKARAELDWHPAHPGLVEEFRHDSHCKLPVGRPAPDR
jgi:hypothetical protein